MRLCSFTTPRCCLGRLFRAWGLAFGLAAMALPSNATLLGSLIAAASPLAVDDNLSDSSSGSGESDSEVGESLSPAPWFRSVSAGRRSGVNVAVAAAARNRAGLSFGNQRRAVSGSAQLRPPLRC